MGSKTGPGFGGRDRTMATLKCLACGHDNNVGDESCSSCSSSLNLKLCSACEAINANDAERCHSCNAEFRVEPEVVTFALDAPALQPAEVSAPYGRALPTVWRLATGQARGRSARSTAVFALLPLLVGGAAYYFYASSQAPAQPHAAPKVETAEKSEPQLRPERAPSAEPARQQAAEPAPAPAVSARIAPPRVTAAPSRSTPLPEPKRTAAAVTHTRAASGGASSRTTPVEAPVKTTAAALPAVTAPVVTAPVVTAPAVTAPVVTAPVPAASAAIMPVSESPAAIAENKRLAVTHTKADLPEAAITTTLPAASAQRTVPAETRNDQPDGCVPAVVALGLCKSK
jgi:hypothetical protein